MLRLVQPVGSAAEAPRRVGPSRSLRLTDDEARHLRTSIRNIARRHFGTLAALAAALGVSPTVLTRRRRPSPALAVALWRLTGIAVGDMLTGKLAPVAGLAPLPGKDGAP